MGAPKAYTNKSLGKSYCSLQQRRITTTDSASHSPPVLMVVIKPSCWSWICLDSYPLNAKAIRQGFVLKHPPVYVNRLGCHDEDLILRLFIGRKRVENSFNKAGV